VHMIFPEEKDFTFCAVMSRKPEFRRITSASDTKFGFARLVNITEIPVISYNKVSIFLHLINAPVSLYSFETLSRKGQVLEVFPPYERRH
jgi:hypothetical protein